MKFLHQIVIYLFFSIITVGCGNTVKVTDGKADDIVVVYENDVHCAVDGYASFKALKNQMAATHRFVATVSSGDFVQGGSIGSISHGRNIIEIMNEVGYDFVTLGNHEFDYGIPRQQELMKELNSECLCCNFFDLSTGERPYKSYSIVDYGGFKLAFVGMTTPYTLTASNPSYFKDENGEVMYSFSAGHICEVVQEAVNASRKEGADFVVALSHLGDESEGEGLFNVVDMASGTYGIDVVVDAHTHTIMESRVVKNLKGQDVVLTSTGTKFQRMGVLTISRKGKFTTELIETAAYPHRDSWIESFVTRIKEGYQKVAGEVIFDSEVALKCYDQDGKRLTRSLECPIGNFCADAFRTVLDTEIAVFGGGGIRADLPKGNVSFNDIYTMFPFENQACRVKLSGALLLDMLEFSVSLLPAEFGGFLHVSGVRFEYDASLPTPVKTDSNHNFISVDGERRVRKVEVFDKEKGQFLPLDPSRVYTLATVSYLPIHYGDGFTMMKNCISVEDTGILDTDIIREYVEKNKSCHIGSEYSGAEGRISDVSGR